MFSSLYCPKCRKNSYPKHNKVYQLCGEKFFTLAIYCRRCEDLIIHKYSNRQNIEIPTSMQRIRCKETIEQFRNKKPQSRLPEFMNLRQAMRYCGIRDQSVFLKKYRAHNPLVIPHSSRPQYWRQDLDEMMNKSKGGY